MRSRQILAAVAAAGGVAAAVILVPALRLDAARAKAVLDVTFAAGPVEARSAAQALLSLRNTGAAAATLALGDRIDFTYTSGPATTALTFTGSQLEAAPGTIPAGMIQQTLVDAGNVQIGVRLFVQQTVTIAAGATVLVPFDFVAGERGVAPVAVDLLLGKGAGKFPRRLDVRVAKTSPRADVFYGDGADGPLTITTSQAFPSVGSWTDVLVETGATVTVPAGTTIRCTGTFENRGTLVVLPGSPGGGERIDAPSGPIDATKLRAPSLFETERGDAFAAPCRPSVMTGAPAGQASSGALGGFGLGTRVYQLPLSHYRIGGGGGSGALGAIGGSGGGLLRVVARGLVTNTGTIQAAGAASTANRVGSAAAGCGGGAGGIVILASGSRVESTGTIDVRGANGGGPDLLGASGGGGGGGLVIFAAPQLGAFGSTLLLGGLTPQPSGTLTSSIWTGGGGGGACVGDGADGYGVSATGVLDGITAPGGGPLTHKESGVGQLVTFERDPRAIW